MKQVIENNREGQTLLVKRSDSYLISQHGIFGGDTLDILHHSRRKDNERGTVDCYLVKGPKGCHITLYNHEVTLLC